jgi:transketolase
MPASDTHNLDLEAQRLRRMVIEMAHRAGSGHCGGSLSCIELLVVLFHRVLRYRPAEPDWPQRDRFILSKGHAAPALYAVLARCGFFSEETLRSLRTFGSPLQGHPDMRKLPGVEMSTGSLGMGISNGIGMAWTARRLQQVWRTFVLVGDGELNEGQNWEAAMLAAKLALSNLVVLVDANRVQLDGPTDRIMPLGDLAAKFRAFDWNVFSCDGHDCHAIDIALASAIAAERETTPSEQRPTVVIADTIKGKGVSFMEGNHAWHGAPLSNDDYRVAMHDLGKQPS